LYWLMVVLTVVGVGLTFVVPTDETTSGPALLDPQQRTFVALVPDAAAAELRRGHPVELRVESGAVRRALPAELLTAQMTDEAGARRAGLAWSADSTVLLTGTLNRDADAAALTRTAGGGALPDGRAHGRVVVVLRSGRFVDVFLDAVSGLLGKGGDA
jgi:hypothetical protein